jgi:hypothetical protein
MNSSKDLFGIQVDFQPLTGEAHEQELMNFAAVEYDAGASLHAASQPATSARMHSCAEREAQPHFKFEINVIECLRLLSHRSHAFAQAVDKIGI